MIGRTISHYEIQEKLGSGGMGEIFKARDTRLNRTVAIKALSASAMSDPDRRKRFIQEAQAASSLNHPNIITIHDILADAETEYMVMEFIAGSTLDQVVPKGGLGTSKTLQYGVQIAGALGAAHAAGIVHRDLKPGNIMVTPAGLVKVLDFGLAKINVSTELTEKTQTLGGAPLTVEGAILGTVSYMSPEQAEGKRVDARSDIFAFGSVLYEMLTGQKAFDSGSMVSTLTSILRDDARPIGDSVRGVPPELEEIIGRALRKDPAQRWQSMQEVYGVLALLKQRYESGILSETPVLPKETPAKGKAQKKQTVFVMGGIAFLAIFGIGGWWVAMHRSNPRNVAVKVDRNGGGTVAPVTPGGPATPPVAVESPPAGIAAAPDPAPPKKDDGVLTNDGILEMVNAKVAESVILGQIRSSKRNFDLSTAEIIRLTKAGVPTRVLEAMRSPQGVPQSTTASPTTAAGSPAARGSLVPPPSSGTPAPVLLPVAGSAAAVSSPAAPPPTVPPLPTAPPKMVEMAPVTLLAGLPVTITLTTNVPNEPETGMAMNFKVEHDMEVGGRVVIAKGAAVTGEVAGIKKGILLRGAKPTFRLISVDAVDGSKVRLRASPGKVGEKAEHVIEPVGRKDKTLLAPVGTPYVGYIDGPQTVNVKK